jgi:Protein of unknown function (DUF1566)
MFRLSAVSAASFQLFGAAVLCSAVARPASAQIADNLKCYQMKDVLNLSGTADLNTPHFGVDPGCKISKAKFFCVPGTLTNANVVDKTTKQPITPLTISGSDPGARVCYKVKCPTPITAIPDQVVTDEFGTRTVTKFKSSLVCAPAVEGTPVPTPSPTTTPTSTATPPPPRFVDNGDGTVTDNQTGLQWEKKDATCPGPHCVDDTFTWGSGGPDGTAFGAFLGELNKCNSQDGSVVTGGFANRCDWRLPSIVELLTIHDTTQGHCGDSSCIDISCACIDPVFGSTQGSGYWSATIANNQFSNVWAVDFFNPGYGFLNSTTALPVRAVRGGP